MNLSSTLVIVVLGLFLLLHCSQATTDLENQGKVTQLSFTEEGCTGQDGSQVEGSLKPLSDWSYENGVLDLEFQFDCNCCSEFEPDVSTKGSVITIKLVDIAEDHCRCSCIFTEKISFQVEGTDRVKIELSVERYPDYESVTLVDQELSL